MRKGILLSSAVFTFSFLGASTIAQNPLAVAQVRMPPSVQDFAQLNAVEAIQLNPSGDKMLVVRLASDGLYEVEVRRTDDVSVGGISFGAAPAEIRNAIWISNDRILVNLRERVESSTGPGFWGEFFVVFDAEGNLQYRLPGQDPQILSLTTASRGELFIAYDSTGDSSADVHKLDVQTGRSERVYRGNDRRFGFGVDRQGEVRTSTTFDPEQFTATYWARSKSEPSWRILARLSPSDRKIFEPLGFFTNDPDELVVIAQLSDEPAGLHVYSVGRGEITRTLFAHPDVDVTGAVTSRNGDLLGARYSTDRPRVAWFDAGRQARASELDVRFPDRSVLIGDRTESGLAIVRTDGPQDPGSFFLLNDANETSLLGVAMPSLQGKPLASRRFTSFTSRDGVAIPLYVTIPADERTKRPLIVLPHGGPWARDNGGWDEWAQLFAAQGYLVAQPQFRGSRGFSRELWLAGDREWGGKMQDDLDDTVQHLIDTGEADPTRVAMMGWSYGGYAALTAAWRGTGIYQCAIAGAAVSDLDRINAGLDGNFVLRRIQKPTIVGYSPVDHLADATMPVLVIHGDIDQTVPVSHGREAAEALSRGASLHEYLEVEGLDHQLNRFSREHKRQVYTAMVGWLDNQCGL